MKFAQPRQLNATNGELRGILQNNRHTAVLVCQDSIKRLRKPTDLAGSKVMHCRNHLDLATVGKVSDHFAL